MIRITGPSDSKPVSKSKTKKSSGGDFKAALDAASDTNEADASSSVGHVAPTNALFSLQEVDGDEGKKQNFVNEGFDALDYLNSIRMGLINGAIPKEELMKLDALVSKWKDKTDDQKLNEIIAEIEIRSAVELAKLGLR